VARKAAVPFVGVWLEAPLVVRLERVTGRTADASDATAEVGRAQEAYDLGALSWRRYDARRSCAQTARSINKVLC